MNPGDELRVARYQKRCDQAGKLLRRAAHMHAASAACGLASAVLIIRSGDLAGAWWLIAVALALNFFASRIIERARGML